MYDDNSRNFHTTDITSYSGLYNSRFARLSFTSLRWVIATFCSTYICMRVWYVVTRSKINTHDSIEPTRRGSRTLKRTEQNREWEDQPAKRHLVAAGIPFYGAERDTLNFDCIASSAQCIHLCWLAKVQALCNTAILRWCWRARLWRWLLESTELWHEPAPMCAV